MKPIYKLGLIALFFICFAGTCTKEDSTNPTPSDDPNQWILGTWKLTDYQSDYGINWDGSGTLTIDGYGRLPQCVKDNLLTFNSNGTTSTTEGETKCNPSDPDVVQVSSYTLDYPTLIINGETATIRQMSESFLKFQMTDTAGVNNDIVKLLYILEK